MVRMTPKAARRFSHVGLVGMLMFVGACVYQPWHSTNYAEAGFNNNLPYQSPTLWVTDPNPAPKDTVTRDWYATGPQTCATTKATSPDQTMLTTTVTCTWPEAQDVSRETYSNAAHYYFWRYRHINRLNTGATVICDSDFESDDIGSDSTPVPVTSNLVTVWPNPVQWVTTYGWTTLEYSGMHGCGYHGTGWSQHMEQRYVEQRWRVTVTTTALTNTRTNQSVTVTQTPIAKPS